MRILYTNNLELGESEMIWLAAFSREAGLPYCHVEFLEGRGTAMPSSHPTGKL
jgi:hypothetical protein